jgi:hypothetical protein
MLRRLLLSVALAAGMMAAPASAQRIDATRIIELHVNAERHHQAFGGSVVEGGRFRMTFDGIGTFEIMPLVLDEARGIFRVVVYKGVVDAESDELEAVETVDARLGVPVNLRSMPSVGLVVDGMRTANAPAVTTSFASLLSLRARALSVSDRCCVECNGVTACACAVKSDCGYCCVIPCCPPEPMSGPSRFFPAPRTFARAAGQCGEPIIDAERIHTAPRGPSVVAVAGR